jgi:3',5'-cyclic AMP phosphodiesterase CpdA
MVKHSFIIFLTAVLLCLMFLTGCNVDLFGLFGSSDLDNRLKERNSFNFLAEDERNLSLGGEYSFIVLTDTHIEDGNAWGLEKLKDVIAADSNIKFAVVTGDITQYGTAQDVQKFIEIARSLNVPCYPVIGNHDIYFGNWPNWKDRIGSTSYRINADAATLFILDSANAYFGRDQLDWLEREMRTAAGRVFVFSHANIFVESLVDIQQFTDTKERARLVSILRNRAGIMFMGHVHRQTLNEAGNVQYISIEDYRDKRVYCVVSVRQNGIDLQYKKL